MEDFEAMGDETPDDPESFTMIYEETLSEDDENWVWLERECPGFFCSQSLSERKRYGEGTMLL